MTDTAFSCARCESKIKNGTARYLGKRAVQQYKDGQPVVDILLVVCQKCFDEATEDRVYFLDGTDEQKENFRRLCEAPE